MSFNAIFLILRCMTLLSADFSELQNLIGSSLAHAASDIKILRNQFGRFYTILFTVRQTNKPHQKHNLLGRGNFAKHYSYIGLDTIHAQMEQL